MKIDFNDFMKSKYIIFFLLVCYPLWILMMINKLSEFGYNIFAFLWFLLLVPIGCLIVLYLVVKISEGLCNSLPFAQEKKDG